MTYRGNQTLSGTWGEMWINGERVFELSAVNFKVTANREDVQIGSSIDSKIVSFKGEGSYKVKKVYSRFAQILEAWKKGQDMRCQIITKLGDPDAIGGQLERYSIDNVWHNEITLANWEQGSKIEDEIPIGFPPSEVQILDKIQVR